MKDETFEFRKRFLLAQVSRITCQASQHLDLLAANQWCLAAHRGACVPGATCRQRPFFGGMACASQPSLVEQCGKADTRQPDGNTGGPKFDFIIHVTSEVGGSFTYISLVDPCKSTVGRRHGKINYWTVHKASVVIVSSADSSFSTTQVCTCFCQGLHNKLLRPNLEKLLWLFSTQTSQGFGCLDRGNQTHQSAQDSLQVEKPVLTVDLQHSQPNSLCSQANAFTERWNAEEWQSTAQCQKLKSCIQLQTATCQVYHYKEENLVFWKSNVLHVWRKSK